MMLDILTDQLTAVRGELTRVDAKCSHAGRPDRRRPRVRGVGDRAGHGHGLVVWLTGTAGLLLAAAVLVLLSVLRPRLGTGGFRKYAALTTRQIEDDLCYLNDLGAASVFAEDLRVLSQIVDRKYRRLRVAVDLTGVAVVALAAAVLAGVLL